MRVGVLHLILIVVVFPFVFAVWIVSVADGWRASACGTRLVSGTRASRGPLAVFIV